MPVDAEEALRRATLIRSDPSLRGVSRRNIATEEGEVEWEYLAPGRRPHRRGRPNSTLEQHGLTSAWEDVWICPNPRGHIQATGRDVKGRLQYRYHPDWTEITTEMKYDDVVYFASQLPRLRRQVARDIDAGDMSLDTVAALVVELMDLYNIQVGSDEYARANESYGLTTLKSMHVKHIKGEEAEGRHDGVLLHREIWKSWDITIEDDHLVDLILKTNRLGAKDADLFMYISEAGNEVDLKAEHINQYIRASSGMGFTAKNFGTWAATSRCAERLAFLAVPQTESAMKAWKRRVPSVESIDKMWTGGDWEPPATETAKQGHARRHRYRRLGFGHTRAVCRSSYIHPWFLDAWTEGRLAEAWAEYAEMRAMGNRRPGKARPYGF